MSKLITPSLISNIQWLKKCPPSCKAKAYQDLHDTLARIWNEPNKAIQRGMAFEKYLNAFLKQDNPITTEKGPEFMKAYNLCKGGTQQKRTKSFFMLNGIEYCLFGRIDYWFNYLIVDVKTTGNYNGRDYYLNGMQHKIYCFNENIRDFKYVVCEFKNDSDTITKVHEINYFIQDPSSLEKEILNQVITTLDFLESDKDLFKLYNTVFCKY